jgi:flagellar basal-body rod modification protein FlgD
MESLISNVQSSQTFQATSMIGKNVLVPGNTLQLNSNASSFGVDLPASVDQLNVSIKDSAGNIVKHFNLGAQKAGVISLNWNGYSDTGANMNNGAYTFQVSATSAGQSTTATALSYDQITGISNGSQGIALNLSTLGLVDMSQVKQIHN